MGRKVIARILFALMVLCSAAGLISILPSPASGGASMETMSLRGSASRLPEITVYLEALDGGGNLFSEVRPDQLSARVGANPATVREVISFGDFGEGVAYLLLVDVSKSIGKNLFNTMREQLQRWIDGRSEKDRVALIALGSRVTLVQDFTSDKTSLHKALAGLRLVDDETLLHHALVRASEELGRRMDPDLPFRRVIIAFSDGHDDSKGEGTKQEVIEAIKQFHIPIYTVAMQSQHPRSQADLTAFENLKEFARFSGGKAFEAGVMTFAEILKRLERSVRKVLTVRLECSACPADGSVHRLQLNLTTGPKVVMDGLDVRLFPGTSVASAGAGPDTAPKPTAEGEKNEDQPPRETSGNATEAGRPSGESQGGKDVRLGSATPPQQTPPTEEPSRAQKLLTPSYLAGGLIVLVVIAGALFLWFKRKTTSKTPPVIEAQPEPQEAEDAPQDKEPILPADEETPVRVAADADAEEPEGAEVSPHVEGALVRLIQIRGDATGEIYAVHLEDRLIIGRAADECDLILSDDPEISKKHCELIYENGLVFVRDLESTNGTLVNGVPISGRYRLQQDDTMLLGQSEFRVTVVYA